MIRRREKERERGGERKSERKKNALKWEINARLVHKIGNRYSLGDRRSWQIFMVRREIYEIATTTVAARRAVYVARYANASNDNPDIDRASKRREKRFRNTYKFDRLSSVRFYMYFVFIPSYIGKLFVRLTFDKLFENRRNESNMALL